MSEAEPNPVLAKAKPGSLIGVELKCPRGDCDWRESYGSAWMLNEYGVIDPMPDKCPIHNLYVDVEKIVEVIG